MALPSLNYLAEIPCLQHLHAKCSPKLCLLIKFTIEGTLNILHHFLLYISRTQKLHLTDNPELVYYLDCIMLCECIE